MTLPGYDFDLFYSTDDIDMFYYPDLKIMHFVWKRRCSGEAYKKPFFKGLEYAESHNSLYFMSDIRKQGIVGPDDRKWFENYVVPEAKRKGFIKASAIFEGNVFKMYYLNLIVKYTASKKIPTRIFTETTDAAEWLQQETV